jgi:hypothetical protein
MASPSAFLTEDHYAQLKNALDKSKQLQREIDLAKQAGLDVSKQQDALNEFQSKAQLFKSVYFPGRA